MKCDFPDKLFEMLICVTSKHLVKKLLYAPSKNRIAVNTIFYLEEELVLRSLFIFLFYTLFLLQNTHELSWSVCTIIVVCLQATAWCNCRKEMQLAKRTTKKELWSSKNCQSNILNEWEQWSMGLLVAQLIQIHPHSLCKEQPI